MKRFTINMSVAWKCIMEYIMESISILPWIYIFAKIIHEIWKLTEVLRRGIHNFRWRKGNSLECNNIILISSSSFDFSCIINLLHTEYEFIFFLSSQVSFPLRFIVPSQHHYSSSFIWYFHSIFMLCIQFSRPGIVLILYSSIRVKFYRYATNVMA
mgnify:CR=1 FL=1